VNGTHAIIELDWVNRWRMSCTDRLKHDPNYVCEEHFPLPCLLNKNGRETLTKYDILEGVHFPGIIGFNEDICIERLT
jgi:hypothetical protein